MVFSSNLFCLFWIIIIREREFQNYYNNLENEKVSNPKRIDNGRCINGPKRSRDYWKVHITSGYEDLGGPPKFGHMVEKKSATANQQVEVLQMINEGEKDYETTMTCFQSIKSHCGQIYSLCSL